MIIIILPIVAFILFIIWSIVERDGDCLFIGFVTSALIFFFCGIIFGIAVPEIAQYAGAEIITEIDSEQPLMALKDGSGVTGNFFLGSGTVDENEYFYYIIYEPNKGYSSKKIRTDDAYVDYLESEHCEFDKPCLVHWTSTWKSPILRFFASCPFDWYTFYIPEGSIIENYYEVDLEG